MKINNVLKTLEFYNRSDNNTKKTKTKVVTNDNFTVSNEARDFQNVYQAISKTPDIRQDKVELIKKQMEEGTYNVSSEDIANKILFN